VYAVIAVFDVTGYSMSLTLIALTLCAGMWSSPVPDESTVKVVFSHEPAGMILLEFFKSSSDI